MQYAKPETFSREVYNKYIDREKVSGDKVVRHNI